MKVSTVSETASDVVPLDETRTGLLYEYSWHGETIYVLATMAEGRRMFVELETGTWYNGDRGELRLLERAELILGRTPQ